MLAYIIFLLFIVHGLIHLIGLKSDGYKWWQTASGVAWLSACLIMILSGILNFLKADWWWIPGVAAIALSQILIFISRKQARFGTVANLLLLLVVIQGYLHWNYKQQYHREVDKAFEEDHRYKDILTENDIKDLPAAVQKYIRYTGTIGRQKVHNFKVSFHGQLRGSETEPWMDFTSEQYNFIVHPARLFYLDAEMKHFPVAGFHRYKDAHASMDIRLLSLFRVQYQNGPQMDTAETVTFFNDMCCMAPAALIDKRITWDSATDDKVKATFRNDGITVAAWLYFNDKGQLVNFVSDNRFATENHALVKRRWSTPIKNYRNINGINVPGYAEAVYRMPDGDFCYGTFTLADITYNINP